MRRLCAPVLLLLVAAGSWSCPAEDIQTVSLTIVCDNYVHEESLELEWGFSCVVAGLEKTILFDVGGSQCSIRANLQAVGIDLSSIDAMAFSHAHADHIGGFECLLPLPSAISVYVPSWFPSEWKRGVEAQAASTIAVAGRTEICSHAVLTGPVYGAVTEEALCLRTSSGIVVITGCAHPGIVRMVQTAQSLFPGETIALVLGGFHLVEQSEAAIRATAQRLLDLGVVKVAPTHCSGDLARAVFRDVFGANYVEAGVGLVLTL